MRAFMTWEARKPITRLGSMAAGSPVFGLRPMRAFLARTWKTPKPYDTAMASVSTSALA